HGWQFDIMSTSFFLSRRSLKPSAKSGMPVWQDHLFIALARSASDATDFFQIPNGRVVEVGTQVTVSIVRILHNQLILLPKKSMKFSAWLMELYCANGGAVATPVEL